VKGVEEDLKIFLEDFVDFLDGLEASIVKLKKQIHKLVGVIEVKPKLSEETFNILKWENEKGSRLGEYEVAYKKPESSGKLESRLQYFEG